MHVRKPTVILRATVDKQLREILPAEAEAGAGTFRRVTLLCPDSPVLGISIDHPTPHGIGLARGYHVPQFPTGQAVRIVLQPQQTLFGMVLQGGEAFASLIVEYLEGQELD